MRITIRRSLRVGRQAGTPLEDLGVQPDVLHLTSKDDLLERDTDLIHSAGRLLQQEPPLDPSEMVDRYLSREGADEEDREIDAIIDLGAWHYENKDSQTESWTLTDNSNWVWAQVRKEDAYYVLDCKKDGSETRVADRVEARLLALNDPRKLSSDGILKLIPITRGDEAASSVSSTSTQGEFPAPGV